MSGISVRALNDRRVNIHIIIIIYRSCINNTSAVQSLLIFRVDDDDAVWYIFRALISGISILEKRDENGTGENNIKCSDIVVRIEKKINCIMLK